MAENMTFATVSVLQAVAQGQRYGFSIMDATGLPSGTVYPILGRLEDNAWVRSRWEDQQIAHDAKRPPRRYYEITTAGKARLEAALEQFRALAEGGDIAAAATAKETS
jgi:DNA-binding PadR family transcriptional regulator